MKVIDEKGKIFGKINIFDLFVLLALVIIIGLVGYKIIDKKRQSNNQIPTKTYIVTVKSFEMPPTYTEALKKDNRIYYDIDKFVNAKIMTSAKNLQNYCSDTRWSINRGGKTLQGCHHRS